MSERPKTIFKRETPLDIHKNGGGAYSSLGNHHTYLLDKDGKAHVIARKAFEEKFLTAVDALPKPPSEAGAPEDDVAATRGDDGNDHSDSVEGEAGTVVPGVATEDEPGDEQPERWEESWPSSREEGHTKVLSDWVLRAWPASWSPDDSESRKVTGGAHAKDYVEPVLDLTSLLKEADPELLEEYAEARNRYIKAHANARSGVIGDLGYRLAGRGSRLERWLDKYGERHNTRAYERRQAEEAFAPLSVKARKAALNWYDWHDRDGWMIVDDEERNERLLQNMQKLDGDAASKLELDISEEWRRAESEKRDRKAGMILGLGGAAVAGALGAVFNRSTNGSHYQGSLIGSVIVGGAAGVGAERLSRSSGDEDDAEQRARDARESVMLNYDDIRSPDANKDEALTVNAIEGNTDRVQDEKLRRLGGMAITGAGVAFGTYWGVNHLWGWMADRMNNTTPPTNHLGGEATPPAPTHETATATATAPAPTTAPTHDVIAQVPTREASATATVAPTHAPATPAPSPISGPDNNTVITINTPEATAAAGQAGGTSGGSTGVISPRGGTSVSNSGYNISKVIAEGQDKASQGIDAIRHAATEVHDKINDAAAHLRETVLQFIDVQRGNGFTDLFEQQASKLGYTLTDEQAYKLYKEIIERFGPTNILKNGNAYRMPNGDWGIKCVGPAQWAPGVEDWLFKWFASQLK